MSPDEIHAADVLLQAIKDGDSAQVKTLLAADPSLAIVHAPSGESAVLLAVYTGHTELVELLLDAGLQLDLFEAAALGKVTRVVQILNEQPGLMNEYATDGFTALGLAAFFGHEMVVKTLLSHGADVNLRSNNRLMVQPLHSSVANRHLAISETLLAAGADVNSPQQDDFTPLHEAADNGQIDMVRLLLHYGADPRAKNRDGKTSVDIATAKGYQVVAKLL